MLEIVDAPMRTVPQSASCVQQPGWRQAANSISANALRFSRGHQLRTIACVRLAGCTKHGGRYETLVSKCSGPAQH
jgi:hypothetical protein